MRFVALFLILLGQFSFAAEPDCESQLHPKSLEQLMQTLIAGSLDEMDLRYDLRLYVHFLTRDDLYALFKVEREASNDEANLSLHTVTKVSRGKYLQVDFTLRGSGRGVLQALTRLSDPELGRLLKFPRGTWSATKRERVELDPKFILPTERDTLLSSWIQHLGLSVPTENVLRNASIYYFGDLVTRSKDELMRLPNMGRRSFEEIEQLAKKHGFELGVALPDWPPPSVSN